jgi:hypothetical protein
MERQMIEPKEERRRPPPRQRALKKARIVFNDRRSAIDCMVRNLSPHGALLLLSSFVGVPENFDLYIDGEKTCRASRMVWKRDGKTGVEFG